MLALLLVAAYYHIWERGEKFNIFIPQHEGSEFSNEILSENNSDEKGI
jgi:hypothetical protein